MFVVQCVAFSVLVRSVQCLVYDCRVWSIECLVLVIDCFVWSVLKIEYEVWSVEFGE